MCLFFTHQFCLFLSLLVSEVDCGLWLWHSLDFSINLLMNGLQCRLMYKLLFVSLICIDWIHFIANAYMPLCLPYLLYLMFWTLYNLKWFIVAANDMTGILTYYAQSIEKLSDISMKLEMNTCCCFMIFSYMYLGTRHICNLPSVNLLTLFLVRLRQTPKRLTSTKCTYFRQ